VTVSVVMAAWNAEEHVDDAIASVLAQTVGDWEVLVADDGSTDGTRAAVRAHRDDRIQLIELEHSGLPAVARNNAIARARGEWIALLDADDVWRPAKLARQLAAATATGADVVHTAAELLRDGRVEQSNVVVPAGETFVALLRGNFVFSSSALVRRALLELHGAFDPDPRLRGSLDYDLWLRLAPHARFAYVDEPLVGYRVHAAQMSGDVSEMNVGALTALENARRLYPELVRVHEFEWSRYVGILRCTSGLPGRGRRELFRAVRRRPLDAGAWAWLVRALRPDQRRRAAASS